MKRILPVVVLALAVACSDSGPVAPVNPRVTPEADPNFVIGSTVIVSNNNDAGFGSFRGAIDKANANPGIRNVEFLWHVRTVYLKSTVHFSGRQNLTIDGNRATLDGSGVADDTPAFLATGGGDLKFQSLTVRNSKGEGIDVEVPNPLPAGHDLSVKVTLFNVDIIGNKGHGVLINDQDDASAPEPPERPNEAGSPASIDVTVIGSNFLRNGYSVSDRDGLRVNEGGEGDLNFVSSLSTAADNAADGYELDERDNGDVNLYVFGTKFLRNGPFDPSDLDDGFDIDELSGGSIVGKVVASEANWNYEEGFDFNENDFGDLRVDFSFVEASHNREEGIDLEEDDDFPASNIGATGDLVTTMTWVKANGNAVDGGDGGIKIREKQGGNLVVSLSDIVANGNYTSGIFARESSGGDASAAIKRVIANNNMDTNGNGDGIELEGSYSTPTISNATVNSNAGFGVRSDAGTVTLTSVTANANGLGANGGGATFVIVP